MCCLGGSGVLAARMERPKQSGRGGLLIVHRPILMNKDGEAKHQNKGKNPHHIRKCVRERV